MCVQSTSNLIIFKSIHQQVLKIKHSIKNRVFIFLEVSVNRTITKKTLGDVLFTPSKALVMCLVYNKGIGHCSIFYQNEKSTEK